MGEEPIQYDFLDSAPDFPQRVNELLDELERWSGIRCQPGQCRAVIGPMETFLATIPVERFAPVVAWVGEVLCEVTGGHWGVYQIPWTDYVQPCICLGDRRMTFVGQVARQILAHGEGSREMSIKQAMEHALSLGFVEPAPRTRKVKVSREVLERARRALFGLDGKDE